MLSVYQGSVNPKNYVQVNETCTLGQIMEGLRFVINNKIHTKLDHHQSICKTMREDGYTDYLPTETVVIPISTVLKDEKV